MNNEAKCAGLWWLFDSTNPADHLEARAICEECPIRLQCAQERDALRAGGAVARYSLTGTWAGELYGAQPGALRMLREDMAFTDDEVREAHLRFHHGARDDRTRVGERVYQRRVARKKYARKVAA